jgi:hypothetical protein
MAADGLTFRHKEADDGFFGITCTGLFRIMEIVSGYTLWFKENQRGKL